jgi:Uma2 family endonuclease
MNILATPIEVTPEDLLTMPGGDRYELVDGHLVERPMSVWSSLVGGILYRLVLDYCFVHKVGLAWPADQGYQCYSFSPRLVRRPDVSFIHKSRLTPELLRAGHCPVVPDLAAEVISPNELVYDLDEKLREYLRAGVRLVWIVNPEVRTVRIHRLDGSITGLEEKDELSGEDVIPGFRVPVADLFPPADLIEPPPPVPSENPPS